MPEEQWRPVPGHPEYEVSDLGRVASLRRGARRILVGGRSAGYRTVLLYSPGQARDMQYVHHLVLASFVGPREPEQQVRHLDGNKDHNALANLAYGTRSENMLDRVEHGTDPNAAKTVCAKGHQYDKGNTYRYGRTRKCRKCNAQAVRDSRIRRQFAAANVPTERAA
jgi:hypothetical protein